MKKRKTGEAARPAVALSDDVLRAVEGGAILAAATGPDDGAPEYEHKLGPTNLAKKGVAKISKP